MHVCTTTRGPTHAYWCTRSCRVVAVQYQRGTCPCKATARHLTMVLALALYLCLHLHCTCLCIGIAMTLALHLCLLLGWTCVSITCLICICGEIHTCICICQLWCCIGMGYVGCGAVFVIAPHDCRWHTLAGHDLLHCGCIHCGSIHCSMGSIVGGEVGRAGT